MFPIFWRELEQESCRLPLKYATTHRSRTRSLLSKVCFTFRKWIPKMFTKNTRFTASQSFNSLKCTFYETYAPFKLSFEFFSPCYLPVKVICIFWVKVTLCCQIKTSRKEGNGKKKKKYKFGLNIFAAPSAHSPGSVRGRGDPWLPSDCCTRSLSDRGPAVWKSSCRTCRILQRPVSPGSRLCLRPTDNVGEKKKAF